MADQSTRVDLWVFREGRKTIASSLLFGELEAKLLTLSNGRGDRSDLVDALIRSGELESALADAALPAAPQIAKLTDVLAWHLVSGTPLAHQDNELLFSVQTSGLPQTMEISPPEGFSYYGVNPVDFIDAARSICRIGDPVAIVGIRSIGVTLSAVVAAALSSPHHRVDRIGIRPTGPPYDRVAGFNAEQVRWIEEKRTHRARFLIVDEGPGRSGSTLLSVAEALVALGVSTEQITLLGTRHFHPEELCTKDAVSRWSRFKFALVRAHSSRRFDGYLYIGGGEWRKHFVGEESEWPACWPQMERSKFLSPDGKRLFKFEGMGRLGEEVRARAQLLAETKFGCGIENASGGYLAYPVFSGRPLTHQDLSDGLLEHFARYCSMRDSEFKNESAQSDPLASMVNFNVQQEFGLEYRLTDTDLNSSHRVVADGHMQPHEWLSNGPESIVKVDALSHGDDHFFPGPVSIAWDLAGVIVEWGLTKDAASFFLSRFSSYSGRRLQPCIDSFCLTYSVFRMAYCKMAIPTADFLEQTRLIGDYRRYRRAAEAFLPQETLRSSSMLRRSMDAERAA